MRIIGYCFDLEQFLPEELKDVLCRLADGDLIYGFELALLAEFISQ